MIMGKGHGTARAYRRLRMTARRRRSSVIACRRRSAACVLMTTLRAYAYAAIAARLRASFWNHVTASICFCTAAMSAPSTAPSKDHAMAVQMGMQWSLRP